MEMKLFGDAGTVLEFTDQGHIKPIKWVDEFSINRLICEDAPACPGDFNGDNQVGGSDLAVILSAWGQTGSSTADLNDDDVVDGQDLAIILSVWGACGG